MSKNRNNGRVKSNKNLEVILGKKVHIGKGVGKRVAKQATSAIKIRRQKEKELLASL